MTNDMYAFYDHTPIQCLLCGHSIKATFEEQPDQYEYIMGFGDVPVWERTHVDGHDLGDFDYQTLSGVEILAPTYNCHCGKHFLCNKCHGRDDWKHWLKFCIEGNHGREPFYPLSRSAQRGQ